MILFLFVQLGWTQECPKTKLNKLGKVQSPEITETSGMVVTDSNIWVHNDSGDSATIYALSKEGIYLGKADIKDAYAKDWEEMTSFTKDDQHYLLIGDIGDNHERKKQLELYVVSTPTQPVETTLAYSFSIEYDVGPKDAEAMFVDPNTNDVIVYTKGREGTSYWLRGPLPSEQTTLKLQVFHKEERSKSAPRGRKGMAKLITSADISPDGRWIVTRDYLTAKMWYHPEGQDIATTLKQTHCRIPLPLQQQGETIAFAPDGKSLWTLSEGKRATLYQIELLFAD